MTHILAAALSAALLGADGDRPTTVVDGHTLRVEQPAVVTQVMRPGGPSKQLTLTFAVESKDPARSFAYEIGQRFVARDAAGKEIPLGRAQFSGLRGEPVFRLAGYPPATKSERPPLFGGPLTVALLLPSPDVTTLASLEGDLFVSDVELLDFTFSKADFNLGAVKKVGPAEAKFHLFDEHDRGVDVGFKLKLPARSSAESLTGGSGFGREHFLLYVTEGGRKVRLPAGGGGSGGGRNPPEGDTRVRKEIEFHLTGAVPKPDAVHLLIPLLEYPRRHVFTLKDVSVPAAPKRQSRPGDKISVNSH